MFLIHRKREFDSVRQGFNWNVDSYTKFQVIVLIWRLQFYFRMRRKEAFEGFSKDFKQFIYCFEVQEVFKDGYHCIDKKLDFWENFDLDTYKIGNTFYDYRELPTKYLSVLAARFPDSGRYQRELSSRG